MKTPMKHFNIALLLLSCFGIDGCTSAAAYPEIPPPGEHKVQVVFALDATGSMSGLIGTAKEKIWSIASSFTQSDKSTVVQIGLVFYRDRGDQFVTKLVPLSTDLDNVYEKLMDINADGGGDTPESVNQGLYEAISKMTWDQDTSVYKAIFLVGDCPPHMNYANDVKYPKSCQIAKQKGIVLNTILMGNDATANRIWHEIANCSQGEFMQVNMDANDIVITTPYDEAIASLSSQMDETRIYYGSEKQKQVQYEKRAQSSSLKKSISASTAARRAEYNTATTGNKATYYGTNELVSDYKAGKVQLEKLNAEELPTEMMKMTSQQKGVYLNKMVYRRDSIEKSMNLLIAKRKVYVEQELSKKDSRELDKSFENQVYENVKKQAATKNIKLKGKVKR